MKHSNQVPVRPVTTNAVIVIVCLLVMNLFAASEVGEKCKDFNSCGTPQKPDISNACIGTSCPFSKICQNPGSSHNCSNWAYFACCNEFMMTLDHLGECGLPAVPTGNCIGQNICSDCSAP
jgi:hypothetical protein